MTKVTNKLIIVADAGRYKIFEAAGLKITNLIKEVLMDDVLPKHDRNELHQSFHGMPSSNQAHFFDPRTAPHDIERHDFCKVLIHNIEELLNSKAYQEIVVVAEHKMLGEIRKNVTNKISSLISKEIAKDLIHNSIEDIQSIVFSD